MFFDFICILLYVQVKEVYPVTLNYSIGGEEPSAFDRVRMIPVLVEAKIRWDNDDNKK